MRLFENNGNSLNMKDFLSNSELLSEAADELKLCREKERPDAEKLLRQCIEELQGRYQFVEIEKNTIKMKYDKQVLENYIKLELKEAATNNGQALKFQEIYKLVSKQFNNFFNKDLVYKAIDQLHQNGDIIGDSAQQYRFLM